MRNRYKHHLPPTKGELSELWDEGVLTVDTNVLLDLYRYHEATRERMFGALEHFRGRIWLSHQASAEFIRNRHAVIERAHQVFAKADKHLDDLAKSLTTTINGLNILRLIPKTETDSLRTGVEHEVEEAKLGVEAARASHPDYFRSGDEILERILILFDGAIGPEPDRAKREELLKEAARRVKEKIPPGYLDASKGDDRPAGDYLLWAQILEHAKNLDVPMIFMTSERKKDWWDERLGRLIGPRPELVEEVRHTTTQRIVFYESEHFVKEWSRRQGQEVEAAVLHDIRMVQDWTAPVQVDGDVEILVEGVVSKLANDFPDSDEQVTSRIAETNAAGYGLDQIEILSAGPMELDSARIPFAARAYFSGEQLEERMFCGNSVTADISGELAFDGNEWHVADYEVQAEVDD